MNIQIIAVGKLQKMYRPIQEEFYKRLTRYAKIKEIEVPDEQAPEKLSAAQRADVMLAEWEKTQKKLVPDAFLVALDASGQKCSSPKLAALLKKWQERKNIAFILGGSLGLSKEALARADHVLSFSDMTFTHSMARVILLEQLYRAFKINSGEPYHK